MIFAGSLTFSSCKKKAEEQPATEDTEQGTATDNNAAEFIANDIESMAEKFLKTVYSSPIRAPRPRA